MSPNLPLPLAEFAMFGETIMAALVFLAFLGFLVGGMLLFGWPASLAAGAAGRVRRTSAPLLWGQCLLYLVAFLAICWLHLTIYQTIALDLPPPLGEYLNRQLARMGGGLPPYDPSAPPRYIIPLWIENEKYLFWFACFAFMAALAHRRLADWRFRGALHLAAAVQVAILFWAVDPFAQPLPRFFAEIGPWLADTLGPAERLGLFMRLYPRMVYYYNASYMWLHPPLLFLAYACITITFLASLFMLAGRRRLEVERLAYDHAKLGFFLLTLGMLLGYPWALQAWGPNWWWDPKICASIMMWAVYSTYLHTRLYANRPGMWYFSAGLGILCFVAMLFTFLASFFFPGEHTFQ